MDISRPLQDIQAQLKSVKKSVATGLKFKARYEARPEAEKKNVRTRNRNLGKMARFRNTAQTKHI